MSCIDKSIIRYNTLVVVSLCMVRFSVCVATSMQQEEVESGFNIYAAHYAQRGYCRLGTTGNGKFLEFTFGSTNTYASTIENVDGVQSSLCRKRKLSIPVREFDEALLFYERKSQKLFKVAISRLFAPETNDDNVAKVLRAFSEDFNSMFGIEVPINLPAHLIQKSTESIWSENHLWNSRGADDHFSIDFDIYRLCDSKIKATISLESKRVNRAMSFMTMSRDVSVDIEDL